MGYNNVQNPLSKVSIMAIVNELERRSRQTEAVTCVKKENVYIITVDEKEVKI